MHTMTNADAIAAPARAGRWAAFSALWLPALRFHAPFFALVGVHMACAAILAAAIPGMLPPNIWTLILSLAAFLGAILPLSILSLRFFHLATQVRPKHPIPALLRDVWDFLRQPDRAANGLSVVLVFVLFMNLFSYLKGSIPNIQPFSWDATFMAWDRWMHFGYDPWRLLHPLLGHPPVTFLITGAYHLWFMVMWIMVSALAFARVPSVLRTRFFLAFMLSWGVGGNLLAILFSSAGPCYYGLIGLSPDPFAPLMSYLHSVHETLPLWAIDTQLLLWQGYKGEAIRLGISAMPSMHNGAALLFALTGWLMHRKLGIVLFAFAGLIFLGSIHLGWHYAIDAYAGWAVALLFWWISGVIARRWHAGAWAREYAQAVANYQSRPGTASA